jgi:hypothetical protein
MLSPKLANFTKGEADTREKMGKKQKAVWIKCSLNLLKAEEK